MLLAQAARHGFVRLMALLLMLCSIPLSAQAGSFTALDNITFYRETGTPVPETHHFSVKNPATTYTLHVINGGLEDTTYEYVSSSVIAINGVQIFGPSDFNQNISAVSNPVTLLANNELNVTLYGKPGGAVTFYIVGEDNDLPLINATITPDANGQGWHKDPATVSFSCSDATTEITFCSGDEMVTAEGKHSDILADATHPAIRGDAIDGAGNSNWTTVDILYDATAPQVDVTLSPSANANGWHNSDVQADFSCTDNLSDIASCPVSQTYVTEGKDQALGVTATDKAGNDFTPPDTVSIDKTPPQITSLFTPLANSDGWHNTDITVTYTCSDGLSGIAVCPAPQTSTGQGLSVTISATATDKADNDTTDTQSFKIDQTPPTISATVTPAANANGWHTSDVTVSYTCDDALSGIATCPTAEVVTVVGQGLLISGAAFDKADNPKTVEVLLNIDKTAPYITINSHYDGQLVTEAQQTITGTVSDNNTITQVTVNGLLVTLDATGGFSLPQILNTGDNLISVSATDEAGLIAQYGISIALDDPLPPEPSTVATPLNETTTTSLYDATAFLYSGANPIQTGVAEGTIEPARVAVVRGKITDREGLPISGVTLTVHEHGEFGQTLSRADGVFDLAVNGGGSYVINYQKQGYLPVQRKIDTPWRDYTWLPDVVLLPLDPNVTTIDLTNNTLQVARGSIETDGDGSRQATILFPAGTTATMTLADGSTAPLTTLNVRATEATVGSTGLAAMPADLPPETGYTYAVDFSVDEAIAAGASQVEFSQPVPVYLENFLEFPAGEVVPAGYYDPKQAAWVASKNGRIVLVLSIDANGLAELDIDGSGLAADATALAALGISDAERQQLAQLYLPGQSLWRVPVPHFSWWDFNWPWGLPAGDFFTSLIQSVKDFLTPDDPCQQPGASVIDCQSQALGEVEPITGSDMSLVYTSERVIDRKAAYTLDIPLTGDNIHDDLRGVIVEINVAGRHFRHMPTTLEPNQTYQFTWDGLDGYGRPVQGQQVAKVRIGQIFKMTYYSSNTGFSESFATLPVGLDQGRELGSPITGASSGGGNSVSSNRFITLWEESRRKIGTTLAKEQGLGGWSLSRHHAYDPVAQALIKGDGTSRKAANLDRIITTIAGTGVQGAAGDGGLAVDANYNSPRHIAITPDGTIYTVDRHTLVINYQMNWRIRKITPDGIVRTIYRSSQDLVIAAGPDSSLYVLDRGLYGFVLRIYPDGTQVVVAGGGSSYAENIPATQARLYRPRGLAVAQDGSIFITDPERKRVRKISPSGIINTVAGGGTITHGFANGRYATELNSAYPYAVAAAADGGFYFYDLWDVRVYKVSATGILKIIAGAGYNCGSPYASYLEGRQATSVYICFAYGMQEGPDGQLYLPARTGQILRIDEEGKFRSVVGVGIVPEYNYQQGYGGDNGPAKAARLDFIRGFAIDADGNYVIADQNNHRIRKVFSPLPGYGSEELFITSQDGSEVYVFTPDGRHLRTQHALTDAVLEEFIYNTDGYLVEVRDADGNNITIERDFSTNVATAIVAPDGQRTTLSMGPNGYLATVTNPANETVKYTYTSGGLLKSRTDANWNTSTMQYDALGRLIDDTNAELGGWELTRTELADGYRVDKSSKLGRTTSYVIRQLANGTERRVNTAPDGTIKRTDRADNGTTTVTAADGTVATTVEGPDPRFGMQAPLLKQQTIKLPSGKTLSMTGSRALDYDINGPSLQTDTVTINGRSATSIYDFTTQSVTSTSPTGRTSTTRIDSLGRPVTAQVADLTPVDYSFDPRGRLQTISQGLRTTSMTYDFDGYLDTVTDAMDRTTSYDYDLAGRLISQQLPDTRVIAYSYDANGNLASITPPGQAAHVFRYNGINLETGYEPPEPDLGSYDTLYDYNIDKQLELITRPDGLQLDYVYDITSGQLTELILPHQSLSYGYDAQGRLSNIDTVEGLSTTHSLTYTYDGSLPLSETSSGLVNASVSRNYSNNFWLNTLSLTVGSSSHATSYGYDNDGLLTQAGDLSLTRDPLNGLLTHTTLGSINTSNGYNSFGELTSHSAGSLYNVSYTRDDIGRIKAKSETVNGVTVNYDYSYDPAGRLTHVSENGVQTHRYDYDDNGNRTQINGQVIASYDAQDRLTSYAGATYTYTPNGELLSKTDNGAITQYDYDVLGNLQAVTLPDATQIDYVHDGRNRRIGKRVNGVLTQGFVYQDQLNPIAELDGNGIITAIFVYGSKANVPDTMIKGGQTYRIISDHLGSPRLVVNSTDGSIAQQLDYDVWGNITNDTNPGLQPFGFAGGLQDPHTGLIRFGARDYDPVTARWTAKDPIRFAGGDSNLYGYVLGDPVNLIDSNGLEIRGGFNQFGGAYNNNPTNSSHNNPSLGEVGAVTVIVSGVVAAGAQYVGATGVVAGSGVVAAAGFGLFIGNWIYDSWATEIQDYLADESTNNSCPI